MRSLTLLAIPLAAAVLVTCTSLSSPEPVGAVFDVEAEATLREMSDFLASADRLEFEAVTMSDPHPDAWPPVRERSVVWFAIERPGRLAGRLRGDHAERDVYLSDEMLTIVDHEQGVYAAIEARETIDESLDLLMDEHDLTIQLAEILYSQPFDAIGEFLDEARFLGLSVVDGRTCRHLACRQEGLEWQLWVEEGERPVPRKIILFYVDEPGTPEYEATWTRWDLAPAGDAARFSYAPPAEVREVELELLLNPEDDR